ncbi:hypothetical protein FACS189447_04360 [Spirochaetia bacterium]|nr:hypothetical protein FACS189447_04360 [Spirochaetia bacterium]
MNQSAIINNNAPRVLWVDFAKVFAMLAVVFLHLGPSAKIGNALETISIPVFIFVSGWLDKNKRTIKETVMDGLKRLLLPYILLCLVVYVFWFIVDFLFHLNYFGLGIYENEPMTETLIKPLIGVALGWGAYTTPFSTMLAFTMWFLPALFFVRIIHSIVYKFTKNNLLYNSIGILIPIFLLLAFKSMNFFIQFGPIGLYRLPFSIDSALMIFPFYALGNIIQRYKIIEKINNKSLLNIFINQIVVLLGFIAIAILIQKARQLDPNSAVFDNNIAYYYLLCLIGITTVVFISLNYIKPSNIINILSNGTLLIMSFHVQINTFLIPLFGDYFHTQYGLLTLFLISITNMALFIVPIKFINKYAPVLMGGRKQNLSNVETPAVIQTLKPESVVPAVGVKKTERVYYFDGIRGWMAIFVMLHHVMLACTAIYTVVYITPLHYFIEIPLLMAIYMFFILSGVVLSMGFMKKQNDSSLASHAIKRIPRLGVPILILSIIVVSMMKLGFMYNLRAAESSGNEWLAIPYNFTPSYLSTLKYSFWDVFIFPYPQIRYSLDLWTISYEFYGTILVLLFLYFSKYFSKGLYIFNTILLVFLAVSTSNIVGFALGILVSHIFINKSEVLEKFQKSTKAKITGVLIFIIIYIIGRGFEDSGLERLIGVMRFIVAFAFICLVLIIPEIQKFFSNKLSIFLGKISFTLYITHSVIVYSFTSFLIYKYGFENASYQYIYGAVTVILALFVGYLFRPLDDISTKASNAFYAGFMNVYNKAKGKGELSEK